MYACEVQICCYNSVKYSTRIKFHFYHLATSCGEKNFYFFYNSKKVYYNFCCCTIDEKVQMSGFFKKFKNLKWYAQKYQRFIWWMT
jgi:hypothetical protein